MPKPDLCRNSLFNYLKHDFPWKRDWNTENLPNIKDSYDYEDVKKALIEIKNINPEIHKFMSYLINSGRYRNDIADFHQCDTSTLKKKCNRGFDMMMNILNNHDVFYQLKPIDLIHYV